MNKKKIKKITIMMIIVAVIIGFIYNIQIWNKTENTNIIVATSTGNIILNIQEKTDILDTFTQLEITDYQLKFGRENIMEINCDLIDDFETKQYCIFEQSDINNINITWESVLKQWDEYITTFKCDTLFSEIWKKYCLEYQTILSKSK